MVTRLIKSQDDCDYVIKNIPDVHSIHQFAMNKKRKLQERAAA